MRSVGDTRTGTGVGPFLRWLGRSRRNLRPSSIYTGSWTRPSVCASLLIASGASDMQVAHQMGHSKIETTKNIYGHLHPGCYEPGSEPSAHLREPRAQGSRRRPCGCL